MAEIETLPSLADVTLPSSPVATAAFAWTKKHLKEYAYNHCIRSAYWSLIIAKKHPGFNTQQLDLELIVLSCILHDMGWSKTEGHISDDKRFEVDGANIAAAYIKDEAKLSDTTWDANRIHLMWDVIALHATPSFSHNHIRPEVAIVSLGIFVDFIGPNFPGGLITEKEYSEVISAFPRAGYKDGFRSEMCGLCKHKPQTTLDNFVSDYGLEYGFDGNGGGKEEFRELWEKRQTGRVLLDFLDAVESLDRETT